MRLFLDTNILLDVIESRPGLVEESTEVLARAEQLEAKLFIAWHSLATIYYLIRRGRTEQETMEEVDQVRPSPSRRNNCHTTGKIEHSINLRYWAGNKLAQHWCVPMSV